MIQDTKQYMREKVIIKIANKKEREKKKTKDRCGVKE